MEAGGWWVDANFKETDLGRIRPGLPARVTVDMYPGLELKGRVESIGAGSGASFALLPAQNATGNWVKVTQRFGVRIALEGAEASARIGAGAVSGAADRPLRLGASATVTLDATGVPPG